uniref:Bromo domain-containing protein n=1 Tax=Astyanax mexicanus TaxID=7994 RepID=A0A8B9K4L0_ASTMX
MAGVSDDYKRLFFHNHLQDELPTAFCRSTSQPGSKYRGTECRQVSEELCNGSSSENTTSHCIKSDLDTTEISDDSRSSSDACSSSAADEEDDENEDDITPEVQQAYRIFHSFLTEKHKALTAPFWHPINAGEKGGNEMSFKMMDNKFVNREYESITEFVADFRLMLENCYRFHSVDHWISKQAQKLEIILEQKLILLSRPLREKTTLAVTSRGRFGTEDEKGPTGTSTRRRSVPRNLAAITVGGCESIMVQALRLEEQQRAKEEKRQRELEKKEAEEASAKEVEEWESSLLSLAEPWPISTMWELPAIGHFLCLAQTALNLPEIVFFELERCLLMPRCSSFLAKVMSSLLCQPNRRATLHRRPALPYRRWEAELRQKVLGWYQEVGRAEDQVAHAEQLGLCHQFFWTLGVMSPLEKMAFHLLPFNQRVWLLKGLCDNVYETQKDVQDAVLGQPIHECRESILGYDSEENAYIHFPHFCGADLRIYCQSPCTPLNFPLPPFHVKKLQREVGVEGSNNVSAVIQGRYLKVKEENSDSSIRELDPLDELRNLISKTEDELDELESTKKRCAGWYVKRESVKELHITLIRLLNELLPWEQKLLKAFQRNRIDSSGHLINEPEVLTALTEFRPLTRSSKRRQSSGLDDDLSPSKRGKLVGDDSVFPEPQSEVTSRDQTTTRANLQVTERDKEITVPLGTFQRNCKPIQALLAKSVGNKVTLMNHPQATSMAHARPLPNRTAAVAPTEPTTTGQLAPQPALVTTRTQTPVTSFATSNSVKVVYNTSEGLSVVQKDGTPFKFSVQPVMDQKTGEKIMQQVIILPSNLLIQRTEETKTQLPSNIQQTVPTSKAAVVLSNSPVSTVPENKIPVQQVAPLKDTSLANKPSPAVSPSLQKLQITSCRTSPAPKKTTEPPSLPNLSPTLSSPSTNSNKCDAKQELKTVCIRDSQSILVTTRGGNTGVVKVQTSEQSGASSLPTSPVFTMLPQFQPFYVSKSSAIGASTAQAPHTTTTATLLPINSSLNNQGNSSKSLPQSPIKYVNQSPLLDRTSSAVTLSKDSAVSLASLSGSLTKTGQTLNSVNSLFPASSQSNSGVLSTARAVQGVPQTTASKGLVQSPLKRFQASSIVPEQSTFQKVFLVAPKTEISAATTSMTTGAPVPSAVPGSRVLFMSQSVSGCSTVTIPKGSVMSGSSSTATTASIAVDAMKPGPNLAQTTGSTPTGTLTKVQGINISGLTARIVDKGTDTNKNLAQQNDTTTTVIPVTMSSVLATSSSGLVFVQKNSSAANSCAPLNVKAPVKLTGSADGKTVTFSTYGNGHMASSALLTAVDQKLQLPSTASISSILQNNKITTESVVTSSNTNLASPSLGSIFNKDTTLPRGLMADKTWASPTVAMVPSPIKPSIITTVARVPNPLTLSTTATPIPGTPPSAPQQGLTPVVRSPVPGSSSVQEKVVINTNAPLAPGTQLFINNMRFVVPAQGLGPGSHVLFFSSPAVRPALPVGTSPVPPVLREAGALNHLPLTHVVQGPRMVAPGMQSNCMPVNLPAKVGTSVPIQQHSTAVRVPLVSTNSTVLAQVTSVGAAISSGQQSLTNVVRLPSFLSSGGKEQCVTLSHNIPTSPKEIVAVSSQLPKSLQSMATPALLQTGLLSTPHQPQLTPVASPAKGVISRASPMIAMPPMSSTVSRMQTLPVATVPPIGSTISCSQATPTATVPPSVNTLIMARCQPVRGVQPGSIRMPVVIPNPSQVQGKAPVQLPGVHPIHPPSKLLLSPDGAILNVVGCPTLQNLPVMANSMTAQTVVTTCSSVTGPVLNTLDSQRILSVNPKGPNY